MSFEKCPSTQIGAIESSFHLQVGGSLSGLMHGLVLKRLGHHVHILERNPADRLESQGAGIRTGDNVGKILTQHDRVGTSLATNNRDVQFSNRAGEIVGLKPRSSQTTSWSTLYYRLRANFDGFKTGYCPEVPAPLQGEGEVVFLAGITVTDIKGAAADSSLTVVYENSTGATASLPADLVIGADGSSSLVRRFVQPHVQRRFGGYIAWRGMVVERDVSPEARALFVEHVNYFQLTRHRRHIVLYAIPGEAGSSKPCDHALAEIADVMRAADGRQHRIALPGGAMRPEVWARQQRFGEVNLPPLFAELVRKTTRPFAQVVTDLAAGRARFWDGRMLLVGDALALFRPHAAVSSNQAALNALLLGKVARGEIRWEEWETRCFGYARVTQAWIETLGCYLNWGYSLATLRSGLWYSYVLSRQWMRGERHPRLR